MMMRMAASESGRRYLPRGGSPNISRGVTYHSRNRKAAPLVSIEVVKGMFMSACQRMAPDSRMNFGGSPDDKRLTAAMTRPQANADSGAHFNPTEAMPSLANSEALVEP